MTNWQHLLYLLPVLSLLAAFATSALRKYKERRHRDFTRSLETLLQPKETVKVICSQKGSRWILTNSRIIFEKKGEFNAFPVKNIKKVQGTNEAGNRTTVPTKMVTLTVQIDREYTLRNTGAEFVDLASQLTAKVKAQNLRKKAREAEKKAASRK